MEKNTEQLIRELADKLGTTTEYLWGVLIKQAAVYSYSNICFILFLGICVYFPFFLTKKLVNKMKNKHNDYEIEMVFGTVVMGVFLIVFIIHVCVTFTDTITGLTNPEYWALQQILKQI